MDTTQHILLCLFLHIDSPAGAFGVSGLPLPQSPLPCSLYIAISAVASPPDKFFLLLHFTPAPTARTYAAVGPPAAQWPPCGRPLNAPRSRPLQLFLRHLTAPLTWNDWQRTLSWCSLPHTTFETYTACVAATFGVHWPLHIRPARVSPPTTRCLQRHPRLNCNTFFHTSPRNSWQQLLSRRHLSPTTYTAYTAAMGQRFGPGWQQQTVHMTPAEAALWQQQRSAHSHCPLPPEIHSLPSCHTLSPGMPGSMHSPSSLSRKLLPSNTRRLRSIPLGPPGQPQPPRSPSPNSSNSLLRGYVATAAHPDHSTCYYHPAPHKTPCHPPRDPSPANVGHA